jgi:hypothetical protein
MDLSACQELLEEAFEQETNREVLLLIDSALSRTDVGETPTEELEKLAELVPPSSSEEEKARVERQIRARAAALWNIDWQTAMYGELVQVLDSENFQEYRSSMLERLERATASYEAAITPPSEITLEEEVRNQLFLEGLDDLRESLDYLESTPQAALKWAEQGNRLLIAVQLFADRFNPGWINVRGGIAPPHPVPAGTDADGTPLYVAASHVFSQRVPGTTRPPFHQAVISYHGEVLVVSDFEMLSDLQVAWVDPDEENWPHVVSTTATFGPESEPWCVARAYYEGQWLPGKALKAGSVCTIPGVEGEHDCEDYQILVRI